MPKQLLFLAAAWLLISFAISAAQQPKSKATKTARPKSAAKKLDPWDRPEGSIVDQTARYYVWYDSQGWHIRSTAKGLRTFHGTVRVKDARIKSCVPVGLKDGRQKGMPDAWRVNDKRSELTFRFRTAAKSDGFDINVEGDGQIEFDLAIDEQKKPQAIFVGGGKGHPDNVPFSLPATPQREKSKTP